MISTRGANIFLQSFTFLKWQRDKLTGGGIGMFREKKGRSSSKGQLIYSHLFEGVFYVHPASGGGKEEERETRIHPTNLYMLQSFFNLFHVIVENPLCIYVLYYIFVLATLYSVQNKSCYILYFLLKFELWNYFSSNFY